MTDSYWSNFSPIPSSRLIRIADNDNDDEIDKIIDNHLYGRSIQIFSTNILFQQQVKNFLVDHNEMGFLFVKNLPIFLLIQDEFIQTYWNNGNVYGLSVDQDVNTENTMAIIDRKRILLSLNSQTYHRLGIIGKESIMNRTKCLTPKYRIVIDLDKPFFKPSKRHYKRIDECLRRSCLTFNVILKWEPNNNHEMSNISPNSLEEYFQYLKQQKNSNDPIISKMTIEKCIPNYRSFYQQVDRIFNVKTITNIENVDENELADFIEWCSAQMAQIKCQTNDLEVSTFQLDTSQSIPVAKPNNLLYGVQIDGFFISTNVKKLIQTLKPFIFNFDQTDSSLMVNAMIVHGFENNPQCWSGTNNEHYKHLSGENLYGFSVLNSMFRLIWCQSDDYDYGIEKF
uniref:Ribonuclease P protein subunit p40-like n=1 Tax=Dermatophagoides pteronyssinus TaxID=6956 RepID=A0A6P6XYL1_DERPT|nr:ribonuclease P protein subunit p40-like [Dermatophagoides pteronyssinus]